MIKLQTILGLPFKQPEPSIEEKKRLKLDQAVQRFATRIDPSLNSVASIKNFIYPDYTTSPLFDFENADDMHETVEAFLSARSDYAAAVSRWAQRKLPEAGLSQHVEFARESLRQIDPELVGEQRYKETDLHVVKFAKWAFFALSRTLTCEAKIEKKAIRLDVLERRHSLEQDRVKATQLFHEEMKDFLPESSPSTLSEIATFFQTQYEDVTPRQLSQSLEQFTAFQKAKTTYFDKLTELDHSLDEIFGRSPLRRDVEEVETSEVDEEIEQPVELDDRTIYKGSLAQEQVKKVITDALATSENKEIATFVAEHLIPTGVKEFVLYKNEKKGEIHFDTPKEGSNSRSETKDRKYVVDQKLIFTFDEAGKVEFQNGGYRIGAVSKDLERHLDKAPTLMRGAARAALGEYLTTGLKLSLNLTGISQTSEGIRLHITPLTGEREIPMEGGLKPAGVIGTLIQKFTSHDDVPFQAMKENYTHFVWE